jgi:hypothetical protein
MQAPPTTAFLHAVISRVPACDSSHALSKLCTLACSRGLTVTSDSQYVNARISQNLTHTVHGLHDGLARPKTGPRTGPRTGLRPGGDARADPSAVARDPAHHFSPLRPSRVSSIRSTVFTCQITSSAPALSSPMLRVTQSQRMHTDHRPSLICLQGLLASALSKTISTNVLSMSHVPCPSCTCNGTRLHGTRA